MSTTSYLNGHVKHDPAGGAVAIRTRFPEDVPELAGMAWLVSTVTLGPRNAATSEVEDWDDLYVPPQTDDSSSTGPS